MTTDATSSSPALPSSDSAYWNKDAPGHAEAVAAEARKYEAAFAAQNAGAPMPSAPTSSKFEPARAAADPDADLYAALDDKNHPQHLAALAERNRRARARFPEEEKPLPDPLADTSPQGLVEAARDRLGTSAPEMPDHLRSQWDVESETLVLDFAEREMIGASTMNAVLQFYVDHVSAFGLEGAEDAFREQFKTRLAPEHLAKLVAFGRAINGLDGDRDF